MDGVEEYPIAKLKTIKTPLVMFDQTTLAHYKKVRMDLQARNRSKDHHMSYQENQNLKTIKPQTLFVRSLGKLSACCLHRWTFVAWSSCCCNWCYRYALERMSVRAVVHVRKVVKWVPPVAPVAPVAMAGGTVDGALVQLNTMFLSGQIDAAEYELRKTAMGLSNTPPTAPPIAVEAVPIGAADGGRGGGGGGFGNIARRQTLTRMEALLIRKGVGQDPRPVKAVGCVAILVVGIFTRILIGSVLVYPCSDWAPSTTRSMKHWCEGSRFRYPPFEVVGYWGGDALLPWNRGEATSGWCTAVNAPSASQGDCSCRVDGARATNRFGDDGKTVTSCLGCVEEDIARDDEHYQRCVLRSTKYTGDMSATATTGILCENTCTNAGVLEPLDSEGTCNDPGKSAYPGQFGPATRWTEYNCDFGTDCDDCGPRTYKIGASNNDGGGGSGAAANPFVVLTSSSCCAEGYMPIVIESACETAGHTARVTVPTECSGKSPNACTQKPWGISLSDYGGPFGCAWQQYGDKQTSKALRFNTFSIPRGAGGKSANTWAVEPFAGQTTPLPTTPELQSICAKTWDGTGGDPARAEVKGACEARMPYKKWFYETTGKLAEGTAGGGSVSLLNGLITVGYIDVGIDLGAGGRGRGPTAAQNHANCSAAGLWTIASEDVCAAAAQELRRTDAHDEWHADPDRFTLNTKAGSTCKCKSDFDDSDRELCWDLETEPASTTTCTWDEPCLCANFTATWEYVALSDGSATSCEALGHTTINDLGECDLARAATDTDHEDLWDPASSSPSAGYTFTVRVSGAGYASGPRGCLRVERGIYHYVVNTDASATGTCDATTTCLCRKG
jgi:hypothetical protein